MDYMTDLNAYLKIGDEATTTARHSTNTKAGSDMDMTDYLQLMVAMFQNQSIDDVASTSDMMNQMVQMTMIQTMTDLRTAVAQTGGLSYAASLVGKEVTIGERDGNNTKEIVGTVTGTGMLNGEQVLFLGDDTMYKLSDVIAVGHVPENVKAADDTKKTGKTDPDAVSELATRLDLSVPKAAELVDLLDRYSSGDSMTMEEMDELQLYGLINGHSGPVDEDFSWLAEEYGVPESMVSEIASMLKYLESGGSMTEDMEKKLVGYGLIEPVDQRVNLYPGEPEQVEDSDSLEKVTESGETRQQDNTATPNEAYEAAAEEINDN